MGKATKIEWTNATWNPWMGCDKVSPGCAHCYMFREQRQYGNDPTLVRRSKTRFEAPLAWRDPQMVFTCSWSDWFHPSADAWREDAWEIVRATPHLTYQILTKRPELALERLPADWNAGYPNVWLGVSIENARHTWRADALREIPAAVRFISAEPLLGSLFEGFDPKRLAKMRAHAPLPPVGRRAPLDLLGIDWLIVGGESGPGAMPMRLEWAREVRAACAAAGTAFFLKQLGGGHDKRGGDAALLDGQLHREMPAPPSCAVA